MMIAPFMGTNETVLVPDYMGAPAAPVGVALWEGEDPAKDQGNDGYGLQWCM